MRLTATAAEGGDQNIYIRTVGEVADCFVACGERHGADVLWAGQCWFVNSPKSIVLDGSESNSGPNEDHEKILTCSAAQSSILKILAKILTL